jgi:hypothetical protein
MLAFTLHDAMKDKIKININISNQTFFQSVYLSKNY